MSRPPKKQQEKRPRLTWRQWRFEPWDTWFFKPAEPWDAPGAHGAETLFPPLARTVAGAIRHAMGEHMHYDWGDLTPADGGMSLRARRSGVEAEKESIEKAFEHMRMMGPYVLRDGERLYPTPEAFILGEDKEDGKLVLAWLYPDRGATVRTDLGCVMLPQCGADLRHMESVSGTWITTHGMNEFLRGAVVDHKELVRLKDIVALEPRIGIEINKKTRTAEATRLVNTVHARLRDGIEVAARVSGFSGGPNQGNVHFGGEGRMASFHAVDEIGDPPGACCTPDPTKKDNRITITFVTAAAFGGDWRDSRWTRNWAYETASNGADGWVLNLLNDITVLVECACVPPYVYEGGYEAASGEDRAVHALLPAGSVWFCEVLAWRRAGCDATVFDLNDLITRLHGKQLGSERELGRGEIAVGFWR